MNKKKHIIIIPSNMGYNTVTFHLKKQYSIKEATIFLPDYHAYQAVLHTYLALGDSFSKLFQSRQQIFLGHYTILWVHPNASNTMSIIGALQLSVLSNNYKPFSYILNFIWKFSTRKIQERNKDAINQ
jgi:hypothetical protein